MKDQVAMNEAITKAVAEATRVAIQAIAEAQSQRSEGQQGPKLGGPALKQSQFNWEATDKYTEWKAFILEVRNILSMHNDHEQDKIAMVKNWLGRKGLHYLESLTEAEKHACDTLQGLFKTLAAKFKPQFNETIKSLQFRKLYRFKGESTEVWMGRLRTAVAECNYKEIDRQLKEQFIHRLNNKAMLDEVVRELMAKNSSKQINSEDILLWARQIKAQRAQATILSDITKEQKFDKVKLVQKPKNRQEIETTCQAFHKHQCKYCGGSHAIRQCSAYGKSCASCGKMVHFKKGCMSKKNHTVHEVEVEVMPEPQEDIETVSINSIYLNRNQSLIKAHLKMQVGKTATEIPYKIDTGSEGNIMPLYIFKKLFKNIPEEQLKGSIKCNIKLKTYNGTHITQLGTCVITIKFKNSKKALCVFCSSGKQPGATQDARHSSNKNT